MRTSSLVTTYIQATFFVALGIWAVANWLRQRDRRSAHLAFATGLFGLSQLVSAAQTTIYNQQAVPPELPPRAWGIISSIILFLAMWAFLLFLSDFVNFHPVVHAVIIVVTLANIVLSIIERPDFRIDPQRGLVDIPGVENPISYRTYLWIVLLYLALVFGALALAFLMYGVRSGGLVRLRMTLIGGGFFLLFVVVGLLPFLILREVSPRTVANVLNVVRYMALVSAPLLFFGFAPPRFLRDRFAEPVEAHAR
jgi:hypothetical protein